MSLSEEKSRELVLCVRRNDVDALFGDHGSHGEPWLSLRNEETIDFWLGKATVAFLPRSIAEDAPAWRHFATYSILQDGDRIFTYRRGSSGSEGRLHGLRSLGVGGHLGIEDYATFQFIGSGLISRCAEREILEELKRLSIGLSLDLAGLIADDSSPVNRVHLGAVYTASVDSGRVYPREDCLADPAWMTVAELRERRSEFEGWSQICIDRLLSSDGGQS